MDKSKIIALQQRLGFRTSGVPDVNFRIAIIGWLAEATEAQVRWLQELLDVDADGERLVRDGIAGAVTRAALLYLIDIQEEPNEEFDMLRLTPDGIQMIIISETGGQFQYHPYPEWPCPKDAYPCKNVGVTIGIGYDLKQETSFQQDWQGFINDATGSKLAKAVGVGGTNAGALAKQLTASGVRIPYDVAVAQFTKVGLHKLCRQAERSYPGLSSLPPNAQAAVVSIVYQWGGGHGSPYKDYTRNTIFPQMARAIAAGDLRGLSSIIRSMKQHGSNSYVARRETEALFVDASTMRVA